MGFEIAFAKNNVSSKVSDLMWEYLSSTPNYEYLSLIYRRKSMHQEDNDSVCMWSMQSLELIVHFNHNNSRFAGKPCTIRSRFAHFLFTRVHPVERRRRIPKAICCFADLINNAKLINPYRLEGWRIQRK